MLHRTIHNVHEREVAAPVEELGPLLDGLGRPGDVVWPAPAWPPMVLDRALSVGAAGGHGAIRYRVVAHDPGRRVVFAFDPGLGMEGTHTLTVTPVDATRSLVRHEIAARTVWPALVIWPVAVRWLHDACIEDAFDRVEAAAGVGPRTPARWSPWVRAIHRVLTAEHAGACAVPATTLLAGALPRVDFADAYGVPARPGMPDDPQAWVDAVFRDPPGWVVAAMGLREALVGLVGIARGGDSSFAPAARTGDEVLLGSDEKHLDFRASVLREPDRVVVSTVVQIHNTLGRAYFVPVRLVHPLIVRAMLTRAAHRLSRKSDAGSAQVSRMAP